MTSPADSCVFCAIRRDPSSATVVWSAPEAVVVMDVAPSAPGQLVVIPGPSPDSLAEATRLLPRCVAALAAAFAREAVHAVTRWDLAEPDHPHPVLTVIPGPHGPRHNPLGAFVTRAQLEADARLIVAAFAAAAGP
ncbi:HIT family protein [Kitasatospora gansuensis]